MADVNGCAEFFECTFNNADSTVNTGTEAAGIGKDNGFESCAFRFQTAFVSFEGVFLCSKPSITKQTAPTQIKLSAMLNAG